VRTINVKQFFKRLTVFLLRLVYALGLVGLVGLGLLQVPPVQTWLAAKVTDYLSEKTHFPVHIRAVSIRWLNLAVLKGVEVKDLEGKLMIDIQELTVRFDLPALLRNTDIKLQQAILNQAHVQLVIDRKGDLNIDEFVVALDKLFSSGDTTSAPDQNSAFGIEKIELKQSTFSYNETREDSIKTGLDYFHFTLDSLNGHIHDFFVLGDTVSLRTDEVTTTERRSHFAIHSLNTRFLFCNKAMLFDDLEAIFGNSIIRDSLIFTYNSPNDLSDFVDKVQIAARLDSSVIFSGDLGLFAPNLMPYQDNYRISGNFRGKVSRFRMRDANVYFGKNSHVRGSVSMEGLPEMTGTLINFDLLPSQIDTRDVRQYLSAGTYESASKFGLIRFDAKFQGFTNDFVTNGNFQTDLGNFYADVDLKLGKTSAEAAYKGKLVTQDFQIGKLSRMPEMLQAIDLNGEIEGRGLAVENAVFNLRAGISRVGVYGYDYRSLTVNGKLSRQQFSGAFTAADPNLQAALTGEIDLRPNRNLFDVKGEIRRADFRAIGLSDQVFLLKTRLDVNFQGLEPDKIVGQAILSEAEITYQTRNLLIDSLFVSSRKDSTGNRDFRLASDFADINAEGNFEFSRLTADIKTLLHEYRLSVRNNKKALQRYYEKKKNSPPDRYQIDYQVKLKDINPLADLFVRDLSVSSGTTIGGSFSMGRNPSFALNVAVDTLVYQKKRFFQTNLDFNTSKLFDRPEVLATLSLNSARQDLGAINTEKWELEANWFEIWQICGAVSAFLKTVPK
jgi:hypothetical protein